MVFDVFELFQKNWIYPEVQLMGKFLRFQDTVMMDFPCTLPSELYELFHPHSSKMQEIVKGRGSILATHVDGLLLSS